MFKKLTLFTALAASLLACTKTLTIEKEVMPIITYDTTTVSTEAGSSRFTHEDVIICNEGNWQSDNGQLSIFNGSSQSMTNKWFQTVNSSKLGDTPNDIIQVNDTLIAIAINWSNIVQFIRPNGTACGATEDIPNNRRMCVAGDYLYITSYAHECCGQTFEKGYVAKIDIPTKKIVATCEVGWEPEGIRYYDGKLFVANTGGYAFSEGHDYENTISVLDAETMTKIQDVEIVKPEYGPTGELVAETRVINLYGEMSQAGQYLCINSPGDYSSVPAATVIFDCATLKYTVFDFPCTYNTTDGEVFYTIGSSFSYSTYMYDYYINTINPATLEVTEGIYSPDVTECIKSLENPYELYVSPYTNNVYLTDAKSYANAGYFYAFDNTGASLCAKQKVYICPAHMLAVPHFVVDPVYTNTITITPHISYPSTKSTASSINDRNRQYFEECWRNARR